MLIILTLSCGLFFKSFHADFLFLPKYAFFLILVLCFWRQNSGLNQRPFVPPKFYSEKFHTCRKSWWTSTVNTNILSTLDYQLLTFSWASVIISLSPGIDQCWSAMSSFCIHSHASCPALVTTRMQVGTRGRSREVVPFYWGDRQTAQLSPFASYRQVLCLHLTEPQQSRAHSSIWPDCLSLRPGAGG